MLHTFIVECWIHLLAEKRQEITHSSLQACFEIAYSSGDVLILVLSLDEWTITTQACRDDWVISCIFPADRCKSFPYLYRICRVQKSCQPSSGGRNPTTKPSSFSVDESECGLYKIVGLLQGVVMLLRKTKEVFGGNYGFQREQWATCENNEICNLLQQEQVRVKERLLLKRTKWITIQGDTANNII